MLQMFYKLLWLDDNRLKRHSRLFGWINLLIGGSAVIGAIILYIVISGQFSDIAPWLGELSERLTSVPLDNLRARDVQAASKMLLACSNLITPMPMWASGMFAILGVVVILQGIMFFRIKEILDKN